MKIYKFMNPTGMGGGSTINNHYTVNRISPPATSPLSSPGGLQHPVAIHPPPPGMDERGGSSGHYHVYWLSPVPAN